MLAQLSIPKKKKNATGEGADIALDHELLFVAGLQHIERLSRRIWTDYNIHDPGITTLELLCYALTDLGYRATFPVQDLLASRDENAERMKEQFFTAREILPVRPLTVSDYRKLLIDIIGVQNAWIRPTTVTYYADTIQGELLHEMPADSRGIAEINLAGLYDVLIEFTSDIVSDPERDAVLETVRTRLHANRNLCEDFVDIAGVKTQEFVLCCELELAPDADVTMVHAEILFQVQGYLAPPVYQYSLTEMLSRTGPDGLPYTADRIFDGPDLEHGFILDEELDSSELRTEIRLSDIINIIMDIKGVKAVRDIIISPAGISKPPANKWVIPVEPGRQALLDRTAWRLVSYKRSMPFVPDPAAVLAQWDLLGDTDATNVLSDDLEIPLGTFRNPADYYSFQNHFPSVYGIGQFGLGSAADARQKALAKQLKGYLLFFDQIMANYVAQLNHIADLFSIDPGLERTYFYQVVDSFADYQSTYNVLPGDVVTTIQNEVEDQSVLVERRNRFLDHLIARFAERFHDFAHIMRTELGADAASMIPYKCAFLKNYPAISSGRSMAYNYLLPHDDLHVHTMWQTTNISGLEVRLAALLGIADANRHSGVKIGEGEGMYLVENILLRPEMRGDPFLPICPDPNCAQCYDADPYSYRVHIILPAYGERFGDIGFRRWAEGVIREETPAHIQPKICWISHQDMDTFQNLYRQWLNARAGDSILHAHAPYKAASSIDGKEQAIPHAHRKELSNFITELFRVRNIYPVEHLHECDSPEAESKFILGQSALGTMK